MFSAQDVAKLRQATGVGMMDCKKALEETNGDFDAAVTYLREKGMAAAAKKASRIAAEGVVSSYIHGGGKIGVIVEVNCETDFVARSENFQALCKDIAMQIAASNPKYVRREEVPEEVIESEKAIAKQQAINEGKKPEFADRIVEGRLEKFFKEVCLMEQEFIKDPSMDITRVINEAVLSIGEKITIRRFVRYEMGEGLEKRQDNLAEEVAKMMKKD